MPTLIIAIVSIIALLVLHEAGHFLTAKFLKIRVDEFGIGYPPRIWGKKLGKTLYSLNWLPFGAFVKIPGPDGEVEGIKDEENYEKRPAWQKAAVLFGGVVSFWIIAAILLSIAFMAGVPEAISDEAIAPDAKVQIISLSNNSPAEAAGLNPGDAIKGFEKDGLIYEIDTVGEVQNYVLENQGNEVLILIERGQEEISLPVNLRDNPPEGEGILGIALVRTADHSYPFYQAPLMGVKATVSLTGQVITGWAGVLGSLFSGQGLPGGVSFVGPIGIGSMVNDAAKMGASYFLQFISMIAVYLAVFNILPIPALDGGRLLFLLIEKLRRKPLNKKIEQSLNGAVFVVLLILMALVTIKDVKDLFQ